MKTDEMLQKENPELFNVARKNGTEPPFTGKYVDETRTGMYHCAVCDAPLFASDTKFDSASGWPSFTDPVNRESVQLIEDSSHGMRRVEVRCAACDAHLGHVFPDGPRIHRPDGSTQTCDRFCINSVSLELQEQEKEKAD